jgi:phage FluMu gp28-like protein
MKLLTERAQFLVDNLNLPAATGVDGAKWEPFQIRHLNDDGYFRIEKKSRQIAYSFTVAAEATALAVLEGDSTVFVSINLDEAKEKVRYAKSVYENLEIGGLPKIISDSVLRIELDNNGRIISLPSRPPRGKARMNVVLDEFAHVQRAREIYRAAVPFTTRGGVIRIGSSTMGAGGMFWEIDTEELREFPDYVRSSTPWWRVKSFCSVWPTRGAESLPTAERVEKYGNERIKLLFNNMLLEDFQQEFECLYIDEVTSFFPWELIRKNQVDELICHKVTDAADVPGVVRRMKEQIAAGDIEYALVGGVDIGRTRDLTEIFILGIGASSFPLRLMVSLDRQPFAVQENTIRHILKILPVHEMLVDMTGMGMHLAENLSADTVAEGVTFTNASKKEWASEVKIQMEKTRVPIPVDRDMAYQIHSVKKLISAAKNTLFDTDRNEKHHADKFWAWALGIWAAREYEDAPTWGTV